MTTGSIDSDAVIDGIYTSILEASSVHDMQASLGAALGAPASSMLRIDRGVEHVSWMGVDPAAVENYGSHYHHADPWIAAGATAPLGVGLNVERLVPRDAYLRSGFYNDFMRQHGAPTQLLGMMFAADDARYSLTFMRVAGQADFDDEDERQFACWSPHLTRAFTTRDRLDRQRRDIATTDLLLTDADTTHLLVDQNLGLRWMNRNDLAAVPGLILRPSAAGPMRLEARSSLAQGDLVRAVHDATRRRPPVGGAALLGDRFILVDPYAAIVSREPLALLHIPDRHAIEARAIERATGLFQLTSAEAAMCRRLMHGDTVEAHAAVMGLSRWTVRTHLRNVFAKTGTSRQAELVALLHQLTR